MRSAAGECERRAIHPTPPIDDLWQSLSNMPQSAVGVTSIILDMPKRVISDF
jgi:hypothetical protein